MRVRRIDVGQLSKPVKRADGTMVVQARLARTGVQVYRNDDGSPRREYRPRVQVADQRAVDSFKLVPFTNNHPPEMVTADNARQYMAGAVGQDVHMDGDWLVGTIAVFDAATVRDMESGKTEVSNGYDCDLDMTPGVSPEGEHYDAIQTNITGNHVALVWNARAGHEAAIRMDAAAMVTDETKQKDNVMDLAQALAELAKTQKELGAATARADAAQGELKASKERADKLEADRDAAKEAAEKATKAHKDHADQMDAAVDARVDLLTACTAVLGPKIKRADGAELPLAKLASKDLKLALIKHVTNADCAAKSEAYIDARYDAAIEQAAASSDTFRKTNDHIEALRSDVNGGPRKDVSDAYNQMIEDNRNGWRADGSTVAKPKA